MNIHSLSGLGKNEFLKNYLILTWGIIVAWATLYNNKTIPILPIPFPINISYSPADPDSSSLTILFSLLTALLFSLVSPHSPSMTRLDSHHINFIHHINHITSHHKKTKKNKMTFFGVNSNTNKNITHRRRRRGTTDQWDN
jgi:hypothetical protein